MGVLLTGLKFFEPPMLAFFTNMSFRAEVVGDASLNTNANKGDGRKPTDSSHSRDASESGVGLHYGTEGSLATIPDCYTHYCVSWCGIATKK